MPGSGCRVADALCRVPWTAAGIKRRRRCRVRGQRGRADVSVRWL